MLTRACLFLGLPLLAVAASGEWVLIQKTDGTRLEAQVSVPPITLTREGKPVRLPASAILTVESGEPASGQEKERIASALAAVQGGDRQARDAAVEELTRIGLPVLTPLLMALKDTDQHEPKPLYRLFERIMPSRADGFDRTLSLVRLENGDAVRCALPSGSLTVRTAAGAHESLPWSAIRSLAIRRKLVRRTVPVHSLRHCNQIEYLDTGIVLTSGSKTDIEADGFVRLSWNEDGWATDADGLKKPGSPAYKTNLVGGHPFGALIGRVGPQSEVFFVGRRFTKTGLPAGRLALAVNDNPHWQNNLGTYTVKLSATDSYDVGDAQ
jgi:hypothetical protein